MPDPTLPILAFDTAAAHCDVAVVRSGQVLARRTEAMEKGQAERLMPMLEQALSDAGLHWRDLGAIAVGTGPGNFTGVRIAVSAARGLSLALGVPSLGVSAFEALRDPALPAADGAEIISLEAPRGQAYLQLFAGDRPAEPPHLSDPAQAGELFAGSAALRVVGFRAAQIGAILHLPACETAPADPALRIATVALRRLAQGDLPARPAPLYVRPADAAPPADPPPVILP